MLVVAGPEPASQRRPADRLLLERYHQAREPAARDQLVERFLPLARRVARRYQWTGEPLDDLVQIAALGLLKAIDRFEPARGTAFSTYAVPTMVGELQHHLRDKSWWVRVPRDLQELAVRVNRISQELTDRLGRSPTAAEIAAECGTTMERVMEARQAAQAHFADSLDAPRDAEDGDGLGEVIGVDDPGFRRAEDAATLAELMPVLSDRAREVLRLRFEEDLTQTEIGERVGISQMHVSRVLRDSIARLSEAAAS